MLGAITNWEGDLFNQFSRLQRQLEDYWAAPGGPTSIRAVAPGSYPAVNIGGTTEGVDVYVFAAGLDKDSIQLEVQQNVLTVNGRVPANEPQNAKAYLRERFNGEFRRAVALPEDVDGDSAQARYRNGLLHISFKRKAEAQPRKIEITH